MADLGRALEFWNLYNGIFIIVVQDYGLLMLRKEVLVGGGSNFVIGAVGYGRTSLGHRSIESEIF
jgi:hypothetical protein